MPHLVPFSKAPRCGAVEQGKKWPRFKQPSSNNPRQTGDCESYAFCLTNQASTAFTAAGSDDAIDVIARLAIDHVFDQAVYVGLEARKLVIEFAGEMQKTDDGGIEALARDQQRNARRVRRAKHGSDAHYKHIELEPLALAVRHLVKSVLGLQHQHQNQKKQNKGQARHILGLVDGMD